MKKVVFNQTGSAEDILEIKETDLPEVKTGQVRIKVKASPINPSDVLFIQGHYGLKPQFPDSPAGFEGAGEIDVIGTGIGDGTALAKGKRVCFATLGAWSECVVVPVYNLMPIPDNISFEEGAQLFINPFTAVAMIEEAKLKTGDWLLLTAGFSSVNKIVVQIAKEQGIKTICTVRHEDQTSLLTELGATTVVNTKTASLGERVKQLTEKKGVNACFESVGGTLGTEALQCMGKDSTFIAYGQLSSQPCELNHSLLIFKNITIKGFWLSQWIQTAGILPKTRMAKEVYDMMKKGKIKLNVTQTFPLEKAAEAVKYNEQAGRVGKIILTC